MTPAQFKAARKSLGYTQAALADILGVNPATIRRWEADPSLKSSVPPKQSACLFIKAMIMMEAMK